MHITRKFFLVSIVFIVLGSLNGFAAEAFGQSDCKNYSGNYQGLCILKTVGLGTGGYSEAISIEQAGCESMNVKMMSHPFFTRLFSGQESVAQNFKINVWESVSNLKGRFVTSSLSMNSSDIHWILRDFTDGVDTCTIAISQEGDFVRLISSELLDNVKTATGLQTADRGRVECLLERRP
ncbi:MAG: hypothetical protein H7301_09980 [Cryobacterium sp.]|nr:hypothetical protein [Oligoflexia bacterium]